MNFRFRSNVENVFRKVEDGIILGVVVLYRRRVFRRDKKVNRLRGVFLFFNFF